MSRLRRLKERKIKNRIKATSCGLALALAIGSSQGLGTYALFTDTEDVASNLAISTGDIDVELYGKGFDITHNIHEIDDDDDDKYDCLEHKIDEIVIKNEGTLNQNLSMDISPVKGISEDKLKEIELELELCKCNEANCKCNIEVEETVYDLIKGKTNIKDDNGKLLVLKPGEEIKINGEVEVDIYEILGDINIKLNVYATQINSKGEISDYGFFDEVSVMNKIRFTENENVIDGDAIKVSANGPNQKEVDVTIDFIGDLALNLSNLTKIEIVKDKNLGAFSESHTGKNGYNVFFNNNHFTIVNVDKTLIDDNGFNIGNTIKLKFIYGKGTNAIEKIFMFDFRDVELVHGNLKLQAKFKLISHRHIEVLSEPEIVEPPKEEVEVPSEPEVMEPPKEEVEVPSEPEVVEPPKEETEAPGKPEVVEPPKVEETVVPSQPDVIAPSKEETEIQE